MWWIVGIVIVVLIVGKMLIDQKKGLRKMNGKTIYELYPFVTEEINEAAFRGKGYRRNETRTSFQLYVRKGEPGVMHNQIIEFKYDFGALYLRWRYKYLHKEMIYERNWYESVGATEEAQRDFAQEVIAEVGRAKHVHELKVINGEL